jgi:hypothetical protein
MTEVRGPLFDGTATRALERLANDAAQRIAEAGLNDWHAALGSSIRVNTGRYESTLRSSNLDGGRLLGDGGMVYGPWLEGTGSRNETTRFKGYAAARRVTQALDAKASALAEPAVERAVREMN